MYYNLLILVFWYLLSQATGPRMQRWLRLTISHLTNSNVLLPATIQLGKRPLQLGYYV
jgi:hypothetical protein